MSDAPDTLDYLAMARTALTEAARREVTTARELLGWLEIAMMALDKAEDADFAGIGVTVHEMDRIAHQRDTIRDLLEQLRERFGRA